MENTTSEKDNKMELGKLLGAGSYGKVYQVQRLSNTNHDQKEQYAIKRNLTDSTADWIFGVREANFLTKLKENPYIVSLKDIVFDKKLPKLRLKETEDDDDDSHEKEIPLSPAPEQHKNDGIHFLMEQMEGDLSDIIFSEKQLSERTQRGMMFQLACAFYYLEHHGILHRDVKPANILFRKRKQESPLGRYELKVTDFGGAEHLTMQTTPVYEITTSWYRAPEMCEHKPYTSKVDVWALGCIFYEIVTMKQLFRVEDDDDRSILKVIHKKHPSLRNKSWSKVLDTDDDSLVDLIQNMMMMDPTKRLSSKEVLYHPYFDSLKEERDRYVSKYIRPVEPLTFKIITGDHREWMMNTVDRVMKEFNAKDKVRAYWYNYRVFFHSVELFDRFMVCLSERQPIESIPPYNMELIYYVCLYISIKYFSLMCAIPEWRHIVPQKYQKQSASRLAEEYEAWFLKQISFHVYQPTVYEYFDTTDYKLEKKQCSMLFQLYVMVKDPFEGTHQDLIGMMMEMNPEFEELFPEDE